MASFENENTSMKFSLTVDDAKKTVSVSKISSTADANKLKRVANTFVPLFAAEPAKVKRDMVDEIVE